MVIFEQIKKLLCDSQSDLVIKAATRIYKDMDIWQLPLSRATQWGMSTVASQRGWEFESWSLGVGMCSVACVGPSNPLTVQSTALKYPTGVGFNNPAGRGMQVDPALLQPWVQEQQW